MPRDINELEAVFIRSAHRYSTSDVSASWQGVLAVCGYVRQTGDSFYLTTTTRSLALTLEGETGRTLPLCQTCWKDKP